MKRKTCWLLLGWSMVARLPDAAAQGTAFNFQGRLSEGGIPASNVYDLRFLLYNAEIGGSQIGTVLLRDNAPVTNGLFGVDLDFGAAAFDGSARWLEISVRPGNSTGIYTILSPRQPVTPVPYSIAARNLTGTLSAGQLTGTVPSGGLAGNYDNAVSLNNAANVFHGNGAALTSLNGANITFATITASQLAPNSVGSVQIGDGSVSSADLASNIGVWTRAGSILSYSGGNVGIGTANPMAPLSMGSSIANTKLALWDNANGSLFGLGIQAAQFRLHLNEAASRFSFLNAPAGAELMTLQGNGNIGLGISNPQALLSQGSSVANTKLALWDDGTGNNLFGLGIQAGQFRLHLNQSASRFSFLDAPAGTEILTIHGGGNIGIGTASPDRPLTVRGSGISSQWISLKNTSGTTLWHFNNASGGLNLAQTGVADYRLFLSTNGNVGIGTSNPQVALHVAGGDMLLGGWRVTEEGSALWFARGLVLDPLMVLDSSGNLYMKGALTQNSDRNLKEHFAPVDAKAVLRKLAAMPIQTWNYQTDSTRHIGPMAQDFHAAFQVGPDDRHITTIDSEGVALAAIQGLNQILQEAEERGQEQNLRIAALETQIANLQAQLDSRLATLEKGKARQP